MTTPATVTREHRAEAARLLGHNPEHWIRHSLYGDWLETGDTSRLNSAMPTVAQAFADRDARIGELDIRRELLIANLSEALATCEELRNANDTTKSQLARVVGALAHVVKVATEDKAVTPGFTRLARSLNAAHELLQEMKQ